MGLGMRAVMTRTNVNRSVLFLGGEWRGVPPRTTSLLIELTFGSDIDVTILPQGTLVIATLNVIDKDPVRTDESSR